MLVTLSGIDNSLSFAQPGIKYDGIPEIPFPRLSVVKLKQFSKALCPMEVTESGTVIDVIFCWFANVLAAIAVTGMPPIDSGITISVSSPSYPVTVYSL